MPQPDPNTPRPEGRQIIPVKGEPLGVVSNWPPALQAALARWGATQAKSPALTALDITGKPLYTLTYGEAPAVGTLRYYDSHRLITGLLLLEQRQGILSGPSSFTSGFHCLL